MNVHFTSSRHRIHSPTEPHRSRSHIPLKTDLGYGTPIVRHALDAEVTYAPGGRDALAIPTPNIDGEPMQNVAASLTQGINEERVRVVEAAPSDDEIENRTVYITSDGSTLTIVDDCSEDPQDTDWAQELQFPYTDLIEGMGYREVIATAYVAVLPGGGQNGGVGVTTVITGEVDADVSPTGTWQAK